MQIDLFNNWFNDLMVQTSGIWRQTLSTTGECHKHAGPKALYATVTIAFSPKEHFEVSDTLTPEIALLARERGWYDYIVFGVLDIMLTIPLSPIKDFKLTIQQIDFNEVESSQIAFRLAARNAASKALDLRSK